MRPDHDSAHLADSLHEAGLQALRSGDYGAAADLLARVLDANPDHAEAQKNLGVALESQGRLAEAVEAYRKATAKTDYAEAHYRLGNVLQALGMFEEAAQSYRRALELVPASPELYNNLGNTLQAQGRLDEAITCYHQAIALDPAKANPYCNLATAFKANGDADRALVFYGLALERDPAYADAYYNLGILLQERVQLDEAVTAYLRAIESRPHHAAAYFNLANTLVDLGRLDEAISAYERSFALDPSNIGLEAAVQLAILYFLRGDAPRSRAMLDRARPIATSSKVQHKSSRNYWTYLDHLLSWHERKGGTATRGPVRPLHVVGESHALSAHGLVVRHRGAEMLCRAHWMSGCKQWHLGNDEANKYKLAFERICATLPTASTVLLTIGEIDCRPDEGILQVWRKDRRKSLDETVQATIDAYLDYVARLAKQYGHEVIIEGVPAAHLPPGRELSAQNADELIAVLRSFNRLLQEAALRRGFAFLDVYALTDRGDGIASGERRLDHYHLQPDAIEEAFRSRYLSAGDR